MNCPVCQVSLLMTDRNGIEIDYCPQCRGIWLDRGELDKIIERSLPASSGNSHSGGYKDQKYHSYKDREYEYKKHKKESFLGDLFDF